MKNAKVIVIRKSTDYVLEAEIDGDIVSFYQQEGDIRRTLYDVTVDDLKKVLEAADDNSHGIQQY